MNDIIMLFKNIIHSFGLRKIRMRRLRKRR